MPARGPCKGGVLREHLCQSPADPNPTCRAPRPGLQMRPHSSGRTADLGAWCLTGMQLSHTLTWQQPWEVGRAALLSSFYG